MVDPDVIFPAAGNNEKPLVHWLRMNMVNANFSTGEDVLPYLGPLPPDDNPHTYYFLLYEHSQQLSFDEVQQYSGSSCVTRLQFRLVNPTLC